MGKQRRGIPAYQEPTTPCLPSLILQQLLSCTSESLEVKLVPPHHLLQRLVLLVSVLKRLVMILPRTPKTGRDSESLFNLESRTDRPPFPLCHPPPPSSSRP